MKRRVFAENTNFCVLFAMTDSIRLDQYLVEIGSVCGNNLANYPQNHFMKFRLWPSINDVICV